MVRLPVFGGLWACTSWAGCAALARDTRLFARRADRLALQVPPEHRHEFQDVASIWADTVLFLDPPRHTVVRKLLSRAFPPEVIEKTRPRIAHLFERLFDDWLRSGDSDIMQPLIHPFSALVIADWFGLPPRTGLVSWLGQTRW